MTKNNKKCIYQNIETTLIYDSFREPVFIYKYNAKSSLLYCKTYSCLYFNSKIKLNLILLHLSQRMEKSIILSKACQLSLLIVIAACKFRLLTLNISLLRSKGIGLIMFDLECTGMVCIVYNLILLTNQTDVLMQVSRSH